MDTIFGKIIRGEIPAEKVFENERILAIKDINQAAPVHLLIMPKKQFNDLNALTKGDMTLLWELIEVSQKLAKEFWRFRRLPSPLTTAPAPASRSSISTSTSSAAATWGQSHEVVTLHHSRSRQNGPPRGRCSGWPVSPCRARS